MMNPMMLLALMGGLGGQGQQQPGQQAPQQQGPQQPVFPAMTAGGATPNQDMMQSPLFAASAYRNTGDWGTAVPNEAIPDDSLLRVGFKARQGPEGMSGWEKFGSFLKNMPTDTRLMLGMGGLDGLMRTLSGKL